MNVFLNQPSVALPNFTYLTSSPRSSTCLANLHLLLFHYKTFHLIPTQDPSSNQSSSAWPPPHIPTTPVLKLMYFGGYITIILWLLYNYCLVSINVLTVRVKRGMGIYQLQELLRLVNTGESFVPDGPGAGQHGLNSHAALYPDSEHIDGDQTMVI